MKKSKTRIYFNKEISSNLLVYIKEKQHHFLKNVLRIKVNDSITIFDGKTGEWRSQVISINRNNTVLSIKEKIYDFIPTSDLWLIFSPIKQYRMNIAIQKATELGISKAIPCLTKYTDIRTLNIKNLYFNAIEAAEQSKRLDVPKIEKPIKLEELLSSWPEDRNLLFCNEKLKSNTNLIDLFKSKDNYNKKWAVLVGPEGGFSESENLLINNIKNIFPFSLGERVLRSDTAITVSLFCVQQLIR
tara:strand:+ start:343 stop:1074 length:732 start_codon:yes stop_codon:yes gene_type:complete